MSQDSSERLTAAVRDAVAGGRRLTVAGAGSKRNILPGTSGDMLTTMEHAGIVSYDPAELVITARAGTPIKALQAELALHNQRLACDPPQFLGQGTVGGMVAAGLSGPGRPWTGAVRDAVLGVVMVNGLGEQLTFGGQVMKNVAGYDVSRLMAGSFGALGVLLEVSLRVAPVWEDDVTIAFDLSAAKSLDRCAAWRQHYLPLQGTWWHGGRFHVRLGGSAASVAAAMHQLGGERVEFSWDHVRDHALDFFKPLSASGDHGDKTLWRLVVPPAAPMVEAYDDMAVMWAGGLRWWWHDDEEAIQTHVKAMGGWAWAMERAPRLPAAERALMRRIKASFDPAGLFGSALPIEVDHAD